MERISVRQLENLVVEINRLTGSPTEPYTKQADGKIKANIGNYHLSGAYGGYCLHRMHSDGGGVTTPLVYGHVPKRELHDAMRAFIAGLVAANDKRVFIQAD